MTIISNNCAGMFEKRSDSYTEMDKRLIFEFFVAAATALGFISEALTFAPCFAATKEIYALPHPSSKKFKPLSLCFEIKSASKMLLKKSPG